MTTTTTLAELAAGAPDAVRILEQYGLDYCCGGKQPLEEACLARALEPEKILGEIVQAGPARVAGRDWQTAPLGELVRHIVDTHHARLRLELPALQARIEKVVAVHGPSDPERLPSLAAVFRGLRQELELHLQKEEQILFPVIEAYGRAESQHRPVPPAPFGSIAYPIAMMEREHSGAGDALEAIRRLTGNFELPSYACNTVRALYEGLQASQRDLHLHIHLENNILFPRAIALERR